MRQAVGVQRLEYLWGLLEHRPTVLLRRHLVRVRVRVRVRIRFRVRIRVRVRVSDQG